MEAYMLFIVISSFFSYFPSSHSHADKEFKECQPSTCGKVGVIAYPFWSDNSRPHYCGRPEFELHCPPDEHPTPSIRIGLQTFNVTYIDPFKYGMTLVRTDFVYDNCSSHFTNTSVSSRLDLFHYDGSYVNVTLFYDCSQDYGGIEFPCQHGTSPTSNSNNSAFYTDYVVKDRRFPELIKNCKHHIQVPLSIDADYYPQQDPLELRALGKGLRVRYEGDEYCGKCWDSNGRCGWNDKTQFTCYCRDGHHPRICPSRRGGFAIINKVLVGVVTAAVAIVAIGLLRLCTIKSWRGRIELCKTSEFDHNIEAFIRNHGSLALTRYKFADVKKMTNSFKDKLGQGGYGSVYKGKLLNGCPVAVKLLKESNDNGEDFINEVASISRTSHVNVVTLVGFCFKGKKKALIYEFMPNGSLDKFIWGVTLKVCKPIYVTRRDKRFVLLFRKSKVGTP